jgi:hypothetical protein
VGLAKQTNILTNSYTDKHTGDRVLPVYTQTCILTNSYTNRQVIQKDRQLTGPTISETWDTVVPEAAPRYKTLDPGFIQMFSTPPTMAAASLDLKGFHALYSILFSPSCTKKQQQKKP